MAEIEFEKIHGQIQEFIAQEAVGVYALNDTEYKLPFSDAVFCATDAPRNRAFFRAIAEQIAVLKKHQADLHVIYAGSGTGILGFFALSLGATSALFLEHNPHSLEFSRKLAQHLKLEAQIEFQEGDATKFVPDRPYDLLLSETLTSGFGREEFPLIINHLRKFGAPESVIIPERFIVTLREKDAAENTLAEQEFSFISAQGFAPQQIKLQNSRTEKVSWHTTCFLSENVVLHSGDCVSFLNEMTQEVAEFLHPLFTLEKVESIP